MRSELRPLRELCTLIADCPHSTPVWTNSGYLVIRNQNIKNGRLDLSAPSFTDAEHFAHRIRRARPTAGDIIFTREAPMGEVCMVPAGLECCVGQRQVLLRPNPQLIDGRFLLFALQSPEVQREIAWNEGTGSTVSNVRIPVLEALRIPTPSLETQQKIGAILGALDDRIDLLWQTNATLESLAKALFKSWFIDFDPVRAKAGGHEPEGMDAATASLFPAEFQESALGSIPRGWQVSRLAEHVSAERGLSYKGAGLCDAGEGLPMHNLNSVLEGGGYKYAGIKHYSGDYKDRHLAVAGDVIVANTEQGHEHRLIGFPAIVPKRYSHALYSHHLYRARLKPESPLTTHVLYYTLKDPAVHAQVIGCANGSTVNMLKLAGLETPQFTCPPANVAEAFEALAHPIRKKMEANVERSEVLGALRDALLPRLISGRLRPLEAQEQSEEAVV